MNVFWTTEQKKISTQGFLFSFLMGVPCTVTYSTTVCHIHVPVSLNAACHWHRQVREQVKIVAQCMCFWACYLCVAVAGLLTAKTGVSNRDVILISHTTRMCYSVVLSPREGRVLNACMDE